MKKDANRAVESEDVECDPNHDNIFLYIKFVSKRKRRPSIALFAQTTSCPMPKTDYPNS